MNVKGIFKVVFDLLMGFVAVNLAVDMVNWALTGESKNGAAFSLDRILDQIIQIPIKILSYIFKLLFEIIEAVVKLLVGFISPEAAEKIDFDFNP